MKDFSLLGRRPCLERLTRASCSKDWKRISAESFLMFPNDPISQGTELNCKVCYLIFLENRVASRRRFSQCIEKIPHTVPDQPFSTCTNTKRKKMFDHSFCASTFFKCRLARSHLCHSLGQDQSTATSCFRTSGV